MTITESGDKRVRQKQNTSDLIRAFRDVREQMTEPSKSKGEKVERRPFSRGFEEAPKKSNSSGKYEMFLKKYNNLEETIDNFKTQDLMYYFREKANEAGVKYVIANMKRDMGIFKKLQNNYSPKEICLMIEFIFNSEQNYLDINITQPTVLSSQWCNKIYQDSLLWLNDNYIPEKPKKTKKDQLKSREWQGNSSEEKVKIGEW